MKAKGEEEPIATTKKEKSLTRTKEGFQEAEALKKTREREGDQPEGEHGLQKA